MTKSTSTREHARQAARHRRQMRQRRRRLVTGAIGVAILTVLVGGVGALLTLGGGSADRAGSNRAASWDAPAFTGGPRLAVDQPVVDHGDVPYSHEVQASYRLRNVGDQPLQIQNPEVEILDGC